MLLHIPGSISSPPWMPWNNKEELLHFPRFSVVYSLSSWILTGMVLYCWTVDVIAAADMPSSTILRLSRTCTLSATIFLGERSDNIATHHGANLTECKRDACHKYRYAVPAHEHNHGSSALQNCKDHFINFIGSADTHTCTVPVWNVADVLARIPMLANDKPAHFDSQQWWWYQHVNGWELVADLQTTLTKRCKGRQFPLQFLSLTSTIQQCVNEQFIVLLSHLFVSKTQQSSFIC